jgi:glycosyltransferase involved in cell wall biosynthesis
MKVAIDSGPLTSGHAVRGIGVNTRELLEGFKSISHKGVQIEDVDFSKDDLSKYDIVHHQYFRPFFVDLPFTKPAGKVVLTIHDLIPLIYPKHYPAGLKGAINFMINKYLIKENVDVIITISETSKKDICRFLGVDPGKVHVIYLAPRSVFKKIENFCTLSVRNSKLEIAKRYGFPESFALYVGDVNYNKNIPGLVKACEIAKIPLVICGKQAKGIEELDLNHPELKHLKNVDWSGVTRLGFIPDEDLVAIYNLATVYVHPSFYEGFGLPVLEAVACGTPIAVAKSQCMVEVMGDDFSYCDPHDAKSIAKAILNPNKNKKLPRNYLWGKTAKETYRLYQSLVGSK